MKLVSHKNHEEWVFQSGDKQYKRVQNEVGKYWVERTEIQGVYFWQGTIQSLSDELERRFQEQRAKEQIEFEAGI